MTTTTTKPEPEQQPEQKPVTAEPRKQPIGQPAVPAGLTPNQSVTLASHKGLRSVQY